MAALKLDAVRIGSLADARLVIVLLHGHAMSPQDLAPFAPALGLPAVFHILRGPVELDEGGRAWWPRDPADIRRRGNPPWDLANERPSGREHARSALADYMRSLGPPCASRPLLLAGYSQGGMLACDMLLHDDVAIDGLALLSSCRIAQDDWAPRLARLQGMPVLVSHGRHDEHLAFSAGEALRDTLQRAGARVEWRAFDGCHELGLPAWRHLRRFAQRLIATRTIGQPRESEDS